MKRGFNKGFIANHNLYNRIDYAGFLFRSKILALININNNTSEQSEYLYSIILNRTNKDIYLSSMSSNDIFIRDLYKSCLLGYDNIYY